MSKYRAVQFDPLYGQNVEMIDPRCLDRWHVFTMLPLACDLVVIVLRLSPFSHNTKTTSWLDPRDKASKPLEECDDDGKLQLCSAKKSSLTSQVLILA